MRTTNNKTRLILSIYFIFAGLVFLSNFAYCKIDQSLKKGVYKKSKEQFPYIVEEMNSPDFIRHEKRKQVTVQFMALKRAVSIYKKEKLGTLSIVAVIISIIGVVVGGIFVAMGIGILKRFNWPSRFITSALILLGLYSFFYFINSTADIEYLDGISVRVWNIASDFSQYKGVKSHVVLSRSFTQYLFLRTVVFVGLILTFYLLPLLYVLQYDSFGQTE